MNPAFLFSLQYPIESKKYANLACSEIVETKYPDLYILDHYKSLKIP